MYDADKREEEVSSDMFRDVVIPPELAKCIAPRKLGGW